MIGFCYNQFFISSNVGKVPDLNFEKTNLLFIVISKEPLLGSSSLLVITIEGLIL